MVNLGLEKAVSQFVHDPLSYTYFTWPWGTGVLEKFSGPEQWQAEVLDYIGREFQKGNRIRVAIGSGHWTGKTALLAMIVHWLMSTWVQPQIVVTANSQLQLMGKTWREVAIWNQRAINGDWFEWTATKFALKEDPATWFAAAIPWNENNPDAFQGAHGAFIFDEAAGIHPTIFEVVEGAMPLLWICTGNRTRNTGDFEDMFSGGRSRRWKTWVIDSRSTKIAKLTGQREEIDEWIQDYGEDSDFVRVRARGLPPKGAFTSYIGQFLVDDAVARQVSPGTYSVFPKVMGVDVGGGGEGYSAICRRQGPKAIQLVRWRTPDSLGVADRVADECKKWEPDFPKSLPIFIDRVGIGDGAYNLLVRWGYNVFGIHAGKDAQRKDLYRNKRAECWARMKNWLETAEIPDDKIFKQDLVGPKFSYNDKTSQLVLERKKDMLSRGLASPDMADSCSLTFAHYVDVIDRSVTLHNQSILSPKNPFDLFKRGQTYNPMARLR